MNNKKINPDEVVSRALLLMKYDSTNTLSENVQKVKKPILNEQGTPVGGTGARIGRVLTSTGANAASQGALRQLMTPGALARIGPFMTSPMGVGIGVVAIVSTALYWAFKDSDGTKQVEQAVTACKTVAKYNKEDEMVKELSLSVNTLIKVKKMVKQGIENEGGAFDFLGGLGTNEELIKQAMDILKKGNIADFCYLVWQYEKAGESLATDLGEDLSDGEMADVTETLDLMVSPYAGGGLKIIPEDSYNIAWYKEKFPCVFRSPGTYSTTHNVKITPEGYTYIVIFGKKRRKADGTIYQKQWRLYGDGARIMTTSGNNQPKETNATLTCGGPSTPVAVVAGQSGADSEIEESIFESVLKRKVVNEVFDDSKIVVLSDAPTEESLFGWEDGKKVAPWNMWLKKYPCLKAKFPTGTPLVDEQGYTYFMNLNPRDKQKYRFYSDGEIYTGDGTKNTNKKWSCPQRGGDVIVESTRNISEQIGFDSGLAGSSSTGGGTSSGGGSSTSGGGYKQCDTFPMTKGCKSLKIMEIQECLKIKPDGKFGDETLNALKSKGYGETLTQEVYDKIKTDCNKTNQPTDSLSDDNDEI